MRYDDSNNRIEPFVLTLIYGLGKWPYATTNLQSFISLFMLITIGPLKEERYICRFPKFFWYLFDRASLI